jgi:lysozyme
MMLDRRAVMLGALGLSFATVAARAYDLNKNGEFAGIIDIYDDNPFKMDEAWNFGVRAVLHETSRGLYKVDSQYHDRRDAALQKGFLWGAFHLPSDEKVESVDDQLKRFLSIENGDNPRIAMAIDWEPTGHPGKGTLSYDGLRLFVEKFSDQKKFYPFIYTNYKMTSSVDAIQIGADDLLGKCPLWYARPNWDESKIQVPKTWRDG